VSKPRSFNGRTIPPEWRTEGCRALGLFASLPPVIVRGALNRVSRAAGNVYFEQIRVLKAGAYRLNITAWNDGIGPRSYFVGFL
jgi:hypothetical protein